METAPDPTPPTHPFIGYHNHNSYPVSFSAGHAQAGPVNVEPGEPIVGPDGKLAPYPNQVLEHQVTMGTLARIPRQSREFANWDRMVDQRATAVVTHRYQATTAERDLRNRSDMSEQSPNVNISSSRGVERNQQSPEYGQLPVGATIGTDGSVQYDGRRFANGVALKLFMEQQQVSGNAPAPAPAPQGPSLAPPPAQAGPGETIRDGMPFVDLAQQPVQASTPPAAVPAALAEAVADESEELAREAAGQRP